MIDQYQVLITHFAGIKAEEKEDWLKRRSVYELQILLRGYQKYRIRNNLFKGLYWEDFIEKIITEKKVKMRDDKLNELGI